MIFGVMDHAHFYRLEDFNVHRPGKGKIAAARIPDIVIRLTEAQADAVLERTEIWEDAGVTMPGDAEMTEEEFERLTESFTIGKRELVFHTATPCVS